MVGEDELNNSYTPIDGHVNLAMEPEVYVDSNQNANGKTMKDVQDYQGIELKPVEGNAAV